MNKKATPSEQTEQIPYSTPIFCFVEHSQGCNYLHPDIETARKEAERLARQPQNIGKKVYILKAVSYCEVKETPVDWTEL